jgi:hypothetical protein
LYTTPDGSTKKAERSISEIGTKEITFGFVGSSESQPTKEKDIRTNATSNAIFIFILIFYSRF